MGNRGGRFHDPATQSLSARRWASRAWIICRLTFKDRHRPVWEAGYTELFFLDEVTALAAGHRPCFECRRSEARAFLSASGVSPPRAPMLDARLHAERLTGAKGRDKKRHAARWADLPDATMVEIDGAFWAVRGGEILCWTPEGYAGKRPRPVSGDVAVLTPPTTMTALEGGYRPVWHDSAWSGDL